MHVACVGWCGGVNAGSLRPLKRPLKRVKGSVRRLHALSEELVQSPWKSPPSMIMWYGHVAGSVLSAMQASLCAARLCGR